MKPNLRDFYFTLDLDNIDLKAADKCVKLIIKEQPVYRVILYFSPLSGFHVEAFCFRKILVAQTRKLYGDDGQRLVHDLIDRCDHTQHDVLWQEKYIGPHLFKQEKITEWHR